MAEYILILWIGATYGGPTTAEFANLHSCEVALAAAKHQWWTAEGICVPKSAAYPHK